MRINFKTQYYKIHERSTKTRIINTNSIIFNKIPHFFFLSQTFINIKFKKFTIIHIYSTSHFQIQIFKNHSLLSISNFIISSKITCLSNIRDLFFFHSQVAGHFNEIRCQVVSSVRRQCQLCGE